MPKDDPKIVVLEDDTSEAPVVSQEMQKYLLAAGVSISLKYYDRSCECFSEWNRVDLKGFSSLLEKVGQLEANQLKSGTKYCDKHEGPSKDKRFQRPDDIISPDIPLYELKAGKRAACTDFSWRTYFSSFGWTAITIALNQTENNA